MAQYSRSNNNKFDPEHSISIVVGGADRIGMV